MKSKLPQRGMAVAITPDTVTAFRRAKPALDALAASARPENPCDGQGRHRHPLGHPMRLQPVAGFLPDHGLDQFEPPGLIHGFGQQLLVAEVIVDHFLPVGFF